MSDIFNEVFTRIYRKDLTVATQTCHKNIDIRFVMDFLKNSFPADKNMGGHCAVDVIQHIFTLLIVEHTPVYIVNKMGSPNRNNDDVELF